MQREIGIIIKVKDAAKAKEEIKGIIDNKILGNVKKFKEGMGEAGTSVKRAGKAAAEARGSFDKLFSKMTTGMGAIYALKRGFSFAMDSFEQGAGLERAAVQFESSIGKVDKFLPTLRAATRGTVDDMKLLATANRAVMEGLDPRQLAATYKMATVASRKLGLDTETSIQTISNAIVRQDESALTTLGTILKMNIGLKVQNALISKNGGVMSGAMAIALRQSVIMGELNRKFGGFNALQEDSAELMQRFRASMDNLKMSVGQALGAALAPLLRIFTRLADGASEFLKTVKDNKGFKTFVQYATILAGIFTAKGIVGGIMMAAKHLGIFVGGLKMAAILAGGFIAFKALGIDLDSISRFAERAQTAFSVFFQLLNNYDEDSGMTSVLTKDKDALGKFFVVIFQAAKIFKVLEAAAIGVFNGISRMIKFVAPMLGSFGTALTDIFQSLSNGTPLAQSSLDRIQKAFEIITMSVVGTAGAIAMFIAKGILIAKVTAIVGGVAAAFETAKIAYIAFTAAAGSMGWIKTTIAAIALLSKSIWAYVAAKTAALALSGPVGWGILAGAAAVTAVGAGYVMSRGSESKEDDRASAPAPRAQNVDSMNQSNPELLQLLKEAKLTRESNQQMNTREEQKESTRRTQTSGKFY